MIICPLCEHIQERGLYCDVCGKAFTVESGADLSVPPMPGLETAQVGDLDLASSASGETPVPLKMVAPEGQPPLTRCRACGQLQPSGQVTCDRCGSRLPRIFSDSEDGGSRASDEDAPLVCRQCGVRARPVGGLCPVCGTRHSTEL